MQRKVVRKRQIFVELVREAQGREEFHRAGEDDSLPSDQDAILPANFMYYT